MSETYINLIAEELWANTLKRSVRYVTEEKYLLSQARITDLEAQLAQHTKIVEAAREHYEGYNLSKPNASSSSTHHTNYLDAQEHIASCRVCQAVRDAEPKKSR